MTITKEQTEFIRANEMHFDLVLNHGQHFQLSNDIAAKVSKIHEQITGASIENCTGCITEGYQTVWNAYQLNQDKRNEPSKNEA